MEGRGELDLTKRIEELDNSLSIALDINDKFQRENKEKDDLIQELRMRIRDMLLISEQHRSILGAEITDRKRLEKEVEDLKLQMSEYLSVRTRGAGSVS
jgi:chromosome segregation ATPase